MTATGRRIKTVQPASHNESQSDVQSTAHSPGSTKPYFFMIARAAGALM